LKDDRKARKKPEFVPLPIAFGIGIRKADARCRIPDSGCHS